MRGASTGSVRATRRTRVAGASGVRRSSRAVAMRNAGDVPVKAWARTLPSVACSPVGSVRTQVTPSRAAPRTCQSRRGVRGGWGGRVRRGRGRREPEWSPEGVVSLGDVAPAGGAGGAVEVFFAEGGVIVRIVERIAAAGHAGSWVLRAVRSAAEGRRPPSTEGQGPRRTVPVVPVAARLPCLACRQLPASDGHDRSVSSGSGPACTGPRPGRRCTAACSGRSVVSFTPSASRWSRATFSSRCLGST